MRKLTENQEQLLLEELPDTEAGQIAYGHYAKKEISRCERQILKMGFLLQTIKDKFPKIKF